MGKIDETSLPDKAKYYSELNLEHMTNEDHKHGRVS